MRRWLALLTIATFVFALPPDEEPAPEPAPQADAGADAQWAIEKPEATPTGDPVRLGLTLEAGKAHATRFAMEMAMNMQVGGNPIPTQMTMEMDMKMGVLKVDQEGNADVEVPFRFTKMAANGQDMTKMLAGMIQPGAKLTARIDKRGAAIPGTVKSEGFGMMASNVEKQLETSPYSQLPENPVRVGDVWEVPAEVFGKAFASGGIEGATVDGDVYAKLEALETHDGADCARIRTVFSLKISGDNMKMQGQPAKGNGRIKGEGVFWHGLDGYSRGGDIKLKMNMNVTMMGQAVVMDSDVKQLLSGGPEPYGTAKEEAQGQESPLPPPPPGG